MSWLNRSCLLTKGSRSAVRKWPAVKVPALIADIGNRTTTSSIFLVPLFSRQACRTTETLQCVSEISAMKKIILADNQSIFRAGVAKTLALQDDIRIIAQCTDNERLSQAIRTFRSSIVIFTSSLQPDLPKLIQLTQAAGSRLIVIAENTESLHTYANHGFDGVIFRDITGPGLVDCVNSVASGQNYLQQKSGRSLTEEADAVGARVRDRLTPKEIKIVALIVQGYKNKEIASHLGTTEQVIKNYLRNVYDKTGVSDRLELALFTIHHRTLAEAAAQAGGQMELATARA